MLLLVTSIGIVFAIVILFVAVSLMLTAIVKFWKWVAGIAVLFFFIVTMENIAGSGSGMSVWGWILLSVFAIAVGMIAGLAKAKKDRLTEREETPDNDIPEKVEYLRFWLTDVEYWCTPGEIRRLSYFPKVNLNAKYSKTTGIIEEITVSADFRIIGLVPKEFEREVLRLMIEKRITSAFLPERYYDRRRCKGMVELELAYIP